MADWGEKRCLMAAGKRGGKFRKGEVPFSQKKQHWSKRGGSAMNRRASRRFGEKKAQKKGGNEKEGERSDRPFIQDRGAFSGPWADDERRWKQTPAKNHFTKGKRGKGSLGLRMLPPRRDMGVIC